MSTGGDEHDNAGAPPPSPPAPLHSVDAEEEDGNELYDLLDAQRMSSASSLHSNVRDMMPDSLAFASGAEADSDHGFRSAAAMLGDAQLETDAFHEVYRSVAAVDFGTQHHMGAIGEDALDQEAFKPLTGPEANAPLCEPAPRVFSRLRLEHTHMFVCCELGALKDAMEEQLRALQVDSMYENAGSFWRGMFYPAEPSAAVDCRVYMNSCPEIGTNRYLIEFVRRTGCSMAFNQLFAQIQDNFIARDLVTKPNGDRVRSIRDLPHPFAAIGSDAPISPSSSSEADPDDDLCGPPRPLLARSTSATTASSVRELDFDDEEDDIECSDEDLFLPLLDMSKSAFEDVHVQGLMLVAYEAKKGNGARLVNVCEDLLPLLVAYVRESPNLEVRRNACSALAAMASDVELHDRMLSCACVPALADVAARTPSPTSLETQRQAARALAGLCTSDDARAAVLAAVQDKAEVFERVARAGDSRLCASIAQVRELLAA